MKKFLCLFMLVFCLSKSSFPQDYKGLWHGYITQYEYPIPSGYVLHVKEHKGNLITGSAYIYSKKYFVFLGRLDFIGTINKLDSKVTELVLVKSEMPTDTLKLCIKFFNLKYLKQNNKDILSGDWSGSSSRTRCLPGEAYLQRYNFDDSVQTNPIPNHILETIKENESPKMNFLTTELTAPIILNVSAISIKLEVHDYLKEDNDSISVYLNRTAIISNLPIKNKAYKKTVRLDKLSGLNEIIIYAENLGTIPPNTCVLVVDDGFKKQRVNIFSSKQSSAVIFLNYSPSNRNPNNFYEDSKFREGIYKTK